VLNPSAEAAVVGGNVLTSQRVTDVILKAFSVCAASQGCMNNLTLGHATLGYYEVLLHTTLSMFHVLLSICFFVVLYDISRLKGVTCHCAHGCYAPILL
jgi:Hydantoinase B/oxoprolinase